MLGEWKVKTSVLRFPVLNRRNEFVCLGSQLHTRLESCLQMLRKTLNYQRRLRLQSENNQALKSQEWLLSEKEKTKIFLITGCLIFFFFLPCGTACRIDLDHSKKCVSLCACPERLPFLNIPGKRVPPNDFSAPPRPALTLTVTCPLAFALTATHVLFPRWRSQSKLPQHSAQVRPWPPYCLRRLSGAADW